MRTRLNKLEAAFGPALHIRSFGRSDHYMVEVEFASLVQVAAWLCMEESFRMDFLEALTLFESKGHLFFSYFIRSQSLKGQLVLRTSTVVPGAEERAIIPSMIGIWPQAEPFETELAPLFGVDFTGTHGSGGVRKVFGTFGGYPLRKAFDWEEEFEP